MEDSRVGTGGFQAAGGADGRHGIEAVALAAGLCCESKLCCCCRLRSFCESLEGGDKGEPSIAEDAIDIPLLSEVRRGKGEPEEASACMMSRRLVVGGVLLVCRCQGALALKEEEVGTRGCG